MGYDLDFRKHFCNKLLLKNEYRTFCKLKLETVLDFETLQRIHEKCSTVFKKQYLPKLVSNGSIKRRCLTI